MKKRKIIIIIIIRYSAFFERIIALTSTIEGKKTSKKRWSLPKILLGREEQVSGSNGASITISEIQEEREPVFSAQSEGEEGRNPLKPDRWNLK